MLMTNGIGATIGMLGAGALVNHFCHYEGEYMVGDWHTTWLVFAGYAAVVMILFLLIFRTPASARTSISTSQAADSANGGDGFVNS